jgi:hypothetical protein
MTEYRDPIRKDLPSISKFGDYNACKAKFQLELLSPEQTPNEWSAYGEEVHAAWDGKDVDLTKEQQEVLAKAIEQEDVLIKQIRETIKSREGLYKHYHEKRIWYKDPETQVELFSGQPDNIFVFPDKDFTALITDLKSLWGHVDPPSRNWQLRGSVVLAAQNFGSTRAVTAILQPNRKFQPPAFYEQEHIIEATEAVHELLQAIHDPNAVATPGPQCAHCSARIICKAALAMPETLTRVARTPRDLVPHLADGLLEDLYAYGKQAESITKVLKDELKGRLKERPDDFGQFHLKPTGDVTNFGDLQKVFAELKDMCGISPDEFRSTMSASLPKIVKIVAEKTELPEDEARESVIRRLTLLGLLKQTPKDLAIEVKR